MLPCIPPTPPTPRDEGQGAVEQKTAPKPVFTGAVEQKTAPKPVFTGSAIPGHIPLRNSAGGQTPSPGSTGVPLQPYSARLARTEDKQVHASQFAHEDTVRAVYKKHAQSFFEEIKQGFLKEAATLRKNAQKAMVRVAKPDAEEGESPRNGADRITLSGLALRVEKQQDEFRNLYRHVRSEFNFAKTATLTPMWKERTLQEIAQGELRTVCGQEVAKVFKEMTASLDDGRTDAAIKRLWESGPMPWETQLRGELNELRDDCRTQFQELTKRSDEGISARAMLVDCCAAIEERQRTATEKLANLENASQHVDVGEALAGARKDILELRRDLSREASTRFTEILRTESREEELQERLQACEAAAMQASKALTTSSEETIQCTDVAREAQRMTEDLACTVRNAVNDTAQAGISASRARAEADVARGFAAGAVETVARNEAMAAQHSIRVNALEGQAEELRRLATRIGDDAATRAKKIEDELSSFRADLGRFESLAAQSSNHSMRMGGLEARAEGLRKLTEGVQIDPSLEPAKSSTEHAASVPMSPVGEDPVFVAAKLRAHLEFAESRIKEIHYHAEQLGDEVSSKARKFADQASQHTSRLEALEGRFEELHRHNSALSTDVGAHARKMIDLAASHTARVEMVEDRLRGLQHHVEGANIDTSMKLRNVSELAAQHTNQLHSIELRNKRVADHQTRTSALFEDVSQLKREVVNINFRVGDAACKRDDPNDLAMGFIEPLGFRDSTNSRFVNISDPEFPDGDESPVPTSQEAVVIDKDLIPATLAVSQASTVQAATDDLASPTSQVHHGQVRSFRRPSNDSQGGVDHGPTLEDLLAKAANPDAQTNPSEMNMLRAQILETVLEAAYNSSIDISFLGSDSSDGAASQSAKTVAEASWSEGASAEAINLCHKLIMESAQNQPDPAEGPAATSGGIDPEEVIVACEEANELSVDIGLPVPQVAADGGVKKVLAEMPRVGIAAAMSTEDLVNNATATERPDSVLSCIEDEYSYGCCQLSVSSREALFDGMATELVRTKLEEYS